MKIHVLAGAVTLVLVFSFVILLANCSEEPEEPRGEGFEAATQTGLFERRQFGFIRTLRGSFQAADSSGATAAAMSFVERYASEFGLSDAEQELGEPIVIDDGDGGSAVEFPRLAGGYPIVGSLIRVHFDADDRIMFVSAALPARAEINATEATVDEADAVVSACQTVADGGGSESAEAPRLLAFNVGLITGEEADTRLAWEVQLDVWDPPARPVAYIDAVTGELLYAYDELMAARSFTYDADQTLDMVTILGEQAAFNLQPALGEPYDMESCRGGPICTPDDFQEGCCGAATLWYVDDDFDPIVDGSPQAETVHRALRTVQGWFLDRFGRDGWDWNGGASHAFAHYGPSHVLQAYWDPHYDVMLFYDRASSLDIVAHEFTHGVSHGSFSRLMNVGESGAIGESFSDVFAVLIDGNWEIKGADESVVRDLDANATRRIADTKSTLLSTSSGDHVHFNSGLMTRVAELLVKGGQHWTTRVNVTRVGDDQTDPMIGQRRFEQIWYRALSVWLTPTSTFEDAREQILGACIWLAKWPSNPSGVRIRDCGSILQAFNAVEIGAYDTDRDAWDDDVDNCREEYNPDQLDLDDNGIGDACEDDPEPDAGTEGSLQVEVRQADLSVGVAEVSLDLLDGGGALLDNSQSDSGGVATFARIDVGSYIVRASKDGYETVEVPAEVIANVVTLVPIGLPRLPEPCDRERIVCPETYTGHDGLERSLTMDYRTACPVVGAADCWRASCNYQLPGSSIQEPTFYVGFCTGRDNQAGCLNDEEQGETTSTFSSPSARANVQFEGSDSDVEDPARMALAEVLLTQVEPWAAPCERIDCPETFTDSTGTYELSPAWAEDTIPHLEESSGEVSTQASCFYTLGRFVLSWAQDEDETVQCRTEPSGGYFGNGVVQAQVYIPRTSDTEVNEERYAFAATLLPQAEERAIPCP